MERVLIATWGNPFQWGEIEYRVECSRLGLQRCEDVAMKNVSTLPVLVKALKPDRTIILALDTLVNLTMNNGVKPGSPGSYDEVVGDVQERIRWFIENRVKPHLSGDDKGLLDDVEIVVLPGVGEFENARVEGDALDFYSSVLRVLAEKLPTGDAEVFLDLTHGINFMPVLTYRALKNLLGILAYLHTAKLYVVNSEPYPQGRREWKERAVEATKLHILSIEAIELLPKPVYSTIKDRPEWSAFISSVTNGFPLVFTTFYPRMDDVAGYIEEGMSGFLAGITVEMAEDVTGQRKVHITRNTPLNGDFRTAVKLYYMLRVFGPVLNVRGSYPKRESTLDELFRITRALFIKMPRIGVVVEDQLCNLKGLQERVGFELNKKGRSIIRKDVRKSLERKGIPLAELYDEVRFRHSSGDKGYNPELKVRNFIAHSGFEFNLTRVRVEDVIRGSRVEKVFVFSYSDKETAMKLSVEALSYRNKEVIC